MNNEYFSSASKNGSNFKLSDNVEVSDVSIGGNMYPFLEAQYCPKYLQMFN